MILLRIVCLADGQPTAHDGCYVEFYDPEMHWQDGSYDGGLLVTTPDPMLAMKFPSLVELLELWKSGPTCHCHSIRADGKPNRPLTAYTVTTVPYGDFSSLPRS